MTSEAYINSWPFKLWNFIANVTSTRTIVAVVTENIRIMISIFNLYISIGPDIEILFA